MGGEQSIQSGPKIYPRDLANMDKPFLGKRGARDAFHVNYKGPDSHLKDRLFAIDFRSEFPIRMPQFGSDFPGGKLKPVSIQTREDHISIVHPNYAINVYVTGLEFPPRSMDTTGFKAVQERISLRNEILEKPSRDKIENLGHKVFQIRTSKNEIVRIAGPAFKEPVFIENCGDRKFSSKADLLSACASLIRRVKELFDVGATHTNIEPTCLCKSKSGYALRGVEGFLDWENPNIEERVKNHSIILNPRTTPPGLAATFYGKNQNSSKAEATAKKITLFATGATIFRMAYALNREKSVNELPESDSLPYFQAMRTDCLVPDKLKPMQDLQDTLSLFSKDQQSLLIKMLRADTEVNINKVKKAFPLTPPELPAELSQKKQPPARVQSPRLNHPVQNIRPSFSPSRVMPVRNEDPFANMDKPFRGKSGSKDDFSVNRHQRIS